jgi:large subunit ribosomal protein L3
MTHVIFIDDKPNSPWFGREVNRAVTIVDTPPMLVASIRGYGQNGGALRAIGESWINDLPRDIRRTMPWPKDYDAKASMNKLSKSLNEIIELRVRLLTQPRQTSIGIKKPTILEMGVFGGTIKDQFEYAKNLLGQEIRVRDIFQPGQFLDVVSVTKGKGFQGVIKRFGVAKLPHKSRKRVRAVGTLGPWHPNRIMYTVPRPGQMGVHQRTEYNKRLLKIGEKTDDINPSGGFSHYGTLESDFLLIDGSIPGPSRRLVQLRMPRRPKPLPEKPPEIVYISTTAKK